MTSKQIARANLDALGVLTRSAVHDLNNLLFTVLCSVELIAEALPPDHPLQAEIREAQEAGSRAVACARELDQIGRVLAPVLTAA